MSLQQIQIRLPGQAILRQKNQRQSLPVTFGISTKSSSSSVYAYTDERFSWSSR